LRVPFKIALAAHLCATGNARVRGSIMSIRSMVLSCCLFLCCVPLCRAGEFEVASGALERTLKSTLFATPDRRFYLNGNAHSGCNLYVEDPHLYFSGNRIFVGVHTGGTYGRQFEGHCIGIPISMNTVISMTPSAEGETIGMADARFERLSDSAEVNYILTPFFSRKLPSSIKLDAGNMLRRVLSRSTETSGYPLSLQRLYIRQAHVMGNYLVVDYDSDMKVN
jgi:hypothetical protein